MRQLMMAFGVVLALQGSVFAQEECLTFSVKQWGAEEAPVLQSAAYRIYWLKTGDDPSGGRMRVDHNTGEFCVTDPVQPLADVLVPVAVRRMVAQTRSTAQLVDAQRKVDAQERGQLQEELVQAERDWDTLTPGQQKATERKRLRLGNLERGVLGQDIPWADPNLTAPATAAERAKGWHLP